MKSKKIYARRRQLREIERQKIIELWKNAQKHPIMRPIRFYKTEAKPVKLEANFIMDARDDEEYFKFLLIRSLAEEIYNGQYYKCESHYNEMNQKVSIRATIEVVPFFSENRKEKHYD